jgi:hypothetical protein
MIGCLDCEYEGNRVCYRSREFILELRNLTHGDGGDRQDLVCTSCHHGVAAHGRRGAENKNREFSMAVPNICSARRKQYMNKYN